jgi:hypothetical protein
MAQNCERSCKQARNCRWGDDDRTADRNYIKEFVLAGNRELGEKHGVECAEAFHHIGPRSPRVDEYLKQHTVPLKQLISLSHLPLHRHNQISTSDGTQAHDRGTPQRP